MDDWASRDSERSTPAIYRRNIHVRPYVRIAKVEQDREQPDPLVTITETLGALNTVGNYIVNMTRGVDSSSYPSKELPSAIYTISKNILGKSLNKTWILLLTIARIFSPTNIPVALLFRP